MRHDDKLNGGVVDVNATHLLNLYTPYTPINRQTPKEADCGLDYSRCTFDKNHNCFESLVVSWWYMDVPNFKGELKLSVHKCFTLAVASLIHPHIMKHKVVTKP